MKIVQYFHRVKSICQETTKLDMSPSLEKLNKQIEGITLESEEEALYASKSRNNNKSSTKVGYKIDDKGRSYQ